MIEVSSEEFVLLSLSPLDGRYEKQINGLKLFFSEYALIQNRIKVEVEWLIYICNELKLAKTRYINEEEINLLRSYYINFGVNEALRVKKIEDSLKHDVKAVEYYIKGLINGSSLDDVSSFIHFCCTSEDINSSAYALMLKNALMVEILPYMQALYVDIVALAKEHKAVAMIGLTHGQAASPTTIGKELINFASRLGIVIKEIRRKTELLSSKVNGAVGNYNVHSLLYPDVNWPEVSKEFIESRLGLTCNLYTTQIEPHDSMVDVFSSIMQFNNILLGLNRDMWGYISRGVFIQKINEKEVGSSTMPHKVNPINFENSEGNIGVANSILSHLFNKLPISRFQRDLSDSSVLRNIGIALGYCLVSYKSTKLGLGKIEVHTKKLLDICNNAWELMSEPIQMMMKKHGITEAYETLKGFSRGKEVDRDSIIEFINKLALSDDAKKVLLGLTPEVYVGLAGKLVDDYQSIL